VTAPQFSPSRNQAAHYHNLDLKLGRMEGDRLSPGTRLKLKETKLHGLSPLANYTDRATAARR
jgi:hypothetical protein